MTTVNGRPTKVQHTLNSSEGVLVSCRLSSGEDVYVPMHALFSLFDSEMAAKIRMQGARQDG